MPLVELNVPTRQGSQLSVVENHLQASLLGQQYVADWRYLGVAAGRGYRLSAGIITAGGDITGLAGLAVNNLDQPSGWVTVDAGYRLIPMEIDFNNDADNDAYDDEQEMFLTADRTQAVPDGITAIEATANLAAGSSIQNMLDGGPGFPGRSGFLVTADITDPVHSDLLAYSIQVMTQLAGEVAATVPAEHRMYKKWDTPASFRGPCSLLLYIGGTNVSEFFGNFEFLCVPEEWFPTS